MHRMHIDECMNRLTHVALVRSEHLWGEEGIEAPVKVWMLEAVLRHKDEQALQGQDANKAPLVSCLGEEVRKGNRIF